MGKVVKAFVSSGTDGWKKRRERETGKAKEGITCYPVAISQYTSLLMHGWSRWVNHDGGGQEGEARCGMAYTVELHP
jgi:hypothetical protein